jgi:hypothetical protein
MKKLALTILAVFICIIAKSQYNKDVIYRTLIKSEYDLDWSKN